MESFVDLSRKYFKYSEQHFIAHFGVSPSTVLKIWNLVVEANCIQIGIQKKHLLWTLLYLKVYPTFDVLSTLTDSDPKTLRKWIFATCVSLSKAGDIKNIVCVSIL
jgi:hypothetical protein